jgi:hypothetical protein
MFNSLRSHDVPVVGGSVAGRCCRRNNLFWLQPQISGCLLRRIPRSRADFIVIHWTRDGFLHWSAALHLRGPTRGGIWWSRRITSIHKEEAIRETLLAAQEIAGKVICVTLGITPTEPSTAYG